jgi:hypothetical protein
MILALRILVTSVDFAIENLAAMVDNESFSSL